MTASSAQYSCLAVTHPLISAVFLFLPSPLPLMHSTSASLSGGGKAVCCQLSPRVFHTTCLLMKDLPSHTSHITNWVTDWQCVTGAHSCCWYHSHKLDDLFIYHSLLSHSPPSFFPYSLVMQLSIFIIFFSVGIPVCICFAAESGEVHQSMAELVLKMLQPNQVWPWFDAISPARLNPGRKLSLDHFHSLHISAFLLLCTPQVPLRFNAVQMTSLTRKGNSVALLMTEAFILHFPSIYLCWTSHIHTPPPPQQKITPKKLSGCSARGSEKNKKKGKTGGWWQRFGTGST